MVVIAMEIAVLIPRPLAGIPFQLAREFQGPFILNLHQDLIN